MSSPILASATQLTRNRRYSGTRNYRVNTNKPVLVLHTTEGSHSRELATNHQYPPHLWYHQDSRSLYQTIPLDKPGYALAHPSGTPETNHRGPCIQVEIFERARNTRFWTDDDYRHLAEDVITPVEQFCVATYGVGVIGGPTTRALSYGDEKSGHGVIASKRSVLRMSDAQWRNAHGIVGHQHVPDNDHWDPGFLDVEKLLSFVGDRGRRTLKALANLMNGQDVVLWQRYLESVGFDLSADGGADGYYGTGTAHYTEKYQKLFGLPVTGEVGELEWANLDELVISPPVEPEPEPEPEPERLGFPDSWDIDDREDIDKYIDQLIADAA